MSQDGWRLQPELHPNVNDLGPSIYRRRQCICMFGDGQYEQFLPWLRAESWIYNNIQLVWRSLTVHSTFRPKKPKSDSSDDSATILVSCLRTLSVANITQPSWYRNEMFGGGRRGTLRVRKTEGDRLSATMPTRHSNLKKLTVAQPFK